MDATLFLLLNGLSGPLDTVWWCITELGKGEYATLITMLLVVAALRRVPVTAIITLVVAALLAGYLTEKIKYAVDRPRPLEALGEDRVHVVGEELRQRSFPSGHTSSAFALCVSACAYLRSRRAWIAGLMLASLVGLSRIMVGAHYPGDVVGGALLGAACGLLLSKLHALALALWARRSRNWQPPPPV